MEIRERRESQSIIYGNTEIRKRREKLQTNLRE